MTTVPDDPTRTDHDEDENAAFTTEALIAQAHKNRLGETYPDAARLLENLPIVLRGLCDFVLSGQATAYDVAVALASLIDAIDHAERPSAKLH